MAGVGQRGRVEPLPRRNHHDISHRQDTAGATVGDQRARVRHRGRHRRRHLSDVIDRTSECLDVTDRVLLDSDSAKPSPATAADRAKFKADLKAARALTGQARIDAIKKVRSDAKAGKYGPRIEKRVEHARARIWGHAPAALKADLKAARAADPADRPAKLHAIFVKAEAGDYGDQVKKHADKLKAIVDGS